jgi:hypothetical protein
MNLSGMSEHLLVTLSDPSPVLMATGVPDEPPTPREPPPPPPDDDDDVPPTPPTEPTPVPMQDPPSQPGGNSPQIV